MPNKNNSTFTPGSCETNKYDSSLTDAAVIVVSDFDVGKVYSTRIQKCFLYSQPRPSLVVRLIARWQGFSNLQQSGGHSSEAELANERQGNCRWILPKLV
jgi:hypothetical protein